MVDCYEVNKCYRCLPTFLLPISPAAQGLPLGADRLDMLPEVSNFHKEEAR